MARYRIHWDIGFGKSSDIIEVDNHDIAMHDAYEAAREEFESQASYGADELFGDEEDED